MRTDRHDEANSPFSQFCGRAYKHGKMSGHHRHLTLIILYIHALYLLKCFLFLANIISFHCSGNIAKVFLELGSRI
jgi:hypothetical protein